jgi:hypothetical protein
LAYYFLFYRLFNKNKYLKKRFENLMKRVREGYGAWAKENDGGTSPPLLLSIRPIITKPTGHY